MNEPAIEIEGLTKQFGAATALDSVELQVPAGTVFGLLGPNGAGKTTLVRILATLLRPDAGTARLAGFDVVRQSNAVRRAIGLSGQFAAVDPYLTGRENLRMIGRLSGLNRSRTKQRTDELLATVGLSDAAGRLVRGYSGGMRRRLDLAASLMRWPDVLFLDEPTTGLDPRGRISLWSTISTLASQGTTVLLTTQYLEEADRLADTIAVIDNGRLIATGTADDLKARVGGDRVEVRIPPHADPETLAADLADLGSAVAVVDTVEGTMVLPISDGLAALERVVTRLRASGVPVTDVALRRPSLDDVFLALTGQPTTAEDSVTIRSSR
ncbi:ATP-binding cassette domain-containing protein [Kribbella sp. NPDC049174]|uniref:ATP-binding cassette domain-containing protein n=1 Tax=Kribbella sp. NPDC049174 TaxID=3364112 RepID=UPI0037244B93